MNITLERAVEILKEALDNKYSKIFHVAFIKRTTGELRDMSCRFGVKSYLKGGSAAYNFSEKNLMSVFDMQKQDYRCINLNSIVSLKINGQEFKIEG